MINILLGAPGSGKSYEAVVYHILEALKRGRKVITNLPLDLDRLRAIDATFPALVDVRGALGRGKREDGSPARVFAAVEDYQDDWRHPDGFGPFFVIDECHFALPKFGTSKAVDEWFSMHRHQNVDVLLITQSAAKISQSVRDLVQICYKVRKAHAFGKDDSYIRRVFDGVRGSEMSSSIRKYKPEFFPLYKSHTQGQAVDEFKPDDTAPFIVKWKRATWFVWILAAFSIFYVYHLATAPKVPKLSNRSTSPIAASASAVVDQLPAASASVVESVALLAPGEVDPVPDPYASKSLHLTGKMAMGDRVVYTFLVSQNGAPVSMLTSSEFVKIGYKWEPMTDCAGTLYWKGRARSITCDVPQISMSAPTAAI